MPGLALVSFVPLGSRQFGLDDYRLGPAPVGGVRLGRALRQACCRLKVPFVREGQAAGESDVLTVLAIGGDWRFVETTWAVSQVLGLEIELLGVASPLPSLATRPASDVLDATGAAGLSRKFEAVSGRRPEWDVLHDGLGGHALADYLADRRPKLVAVPHRPHRSGGRCEVLHALRHIPAPVLVA